MRAAVIYTDKSVRCANAVEEWDALPQFGVAIIVDFDHGIVPGGELYRLQNGRVLFFNDPHAYLQLAFGHRTYDAPYTKIATVPGVKFGAHVDEGWEEIKEMAKKMSLEGCACL